MLFRCWWALGFGLCVLLASTPSVAAEKLSALYQMDLESLLGVKVIVASKKGEDIADAPAVISVVTAEEIEAFGANNLLDVLERLPGVYRMGMYLFNDSAVSIRGQSLDAADVRTLLNINGRPLREYLVGGINDVIYRGIPLEAIERIEVIRGPGSVLYGSGAFSGVINIVTKKPMEKTEAFVSTTIGSFGTKSATASLGTAGEVLNTRTSLKIEDVDGWEYEAFDLSGVYSEEDRGYKNYSGITSWEGNGFALNAFLSRDDADTFDTRGTWPFATYKKTRAFLDLGYVYPLAEDWELGANFTLNYTDHEISGGIFEANSRNFIYELSLKGQITDQIGLTSGVSYSRLYGEDELIGDRSHTSWRNGYLQLDVQPLESLKLVGGFQLNDPIDSGTDVSSRFAGVYRWGRYGVKALYGEAFRSPTWTETSVFSPPVLVGNSKLDPEEIRTTELQLFYRDERIYVALTGFDSELTDRISVDPAEATYINGDDLDSKGFELEGQIRVTAELGLQASVSYQENEDGFGVEDTQRVPNWLGKLGLTYRYPVGIEVGIFDTYVGDIEDFDVPETNEDYDAYHRLSANIIFDIPKLLQRSDLPAMTLSVYGDNLLEADAIYTPDAFLPTPVINTLPYRSGRAFYGTFSLRW